MCLPRLMITPSSSLYHRVGEQLLAIRSSESAGESAADVDCHQTGSAIIAVGNSKIRRDVPCAGAESVPVIQLDVVGAQTDFVDESWGERVRPVRYTVKDRRISEARGEQREGVQAGILLERLRVPAPNAVLIAHVVIDLGVALVHVVVAVRCIEVVVLQPW